MNKLFLGRCMCGPLIPSCRRTCHHRTGIVVRCHKFSSICRPFILNCLTAEPCNVSEFWMVPCKPGPPGRLVSQGKPFAVCAAACRQDDSCKGFDWLPSKQDCWVTTQPGRDKPIKVSINHLTQVCDQHFHSSAKRHSWNNATPVPFFYSYSPKTNDLSCVDIMSFDHNTKCHFWQEIVVFDMQLVLLQTLRSKL